VSTEGRSGVGGSLDGQDEQSRIVLPLETGEQPSLSSGLSDAPWLNRMPPGSLYSVCLSLQYLLQYCSHGVKGTVDDMCYARETTSRGLCGLVCQSRTSERGGEGYCVKEGGGEEEERERERALGLLLCHIPRIEVDP